MYKTTVKIDGMMCGMCEAHVCDAIRKAVPSAKKVKVSKAKKEATFISDEQIDSDLMEKTIKDTGYDFLGCVSEPYKKKGLFV
ncbi:MAG: heavy-metal-associated domain-containing protein [Clostridiales bacterium]|nr:heavy-metal-associated domain-containing protein [Clostridiales bacterium]